MKTVLAVALVLFVLVAVSGKSMILSAFTQRSYCMLDCISSVSLTKRIHIALVECKTYHMNDVEVANVVLEKGIFNCLVVRIC